MPLFCGITQNCFTSTAILDSIPATFLHEFLHMCRRWPYENHHGRRQNLTNLDKISSLIVFQHYGSNTFSWNMLSNNMLGANVSTISTEKSGVNCETKFSYCVFNFFALAKTIFVAKTDYDTHCYIFGFLMKKKK